MEDVTDLNGLGVPQAKQIPLLIQAEQGLLRDENKDFSYAEAQGG